MYFYINATHCDCIPPLPVYEQVAWTPTNPGRKFKSCPIYDKKKKCNFYGFTELEIPSKYYKDLLYNTYEENKRLRNLTNHSTSDESYTDPAPVLSVEVVKMMDELTFIKSKVKVYDKILFVICFIVVAVVVAIVMLPA